VTELINRVWQVNGLVMGSPSTVFLQGKPSHPVKDVR